MQRRKRRVYAAELTEKDEEFLKVVKRYGGFTMDSTGLASAGFEGYGRMLMWRVKRLIALGYLAPNEDGLLNGCPQTYTVRTPDKSEV